MMYSFEDIQVATLEQLREEYQAAAEVALEAESGLVSEAETKLARLDLEAKRAKLNAALELVGHDLVVIDFIADPQDDSQSDTDGTSENEPSLPRSRALDFNPPRHRDIIVAPINHRVAVTSSEPRLTSLQKLAMEVSNHAVDTESMGYGIPVVSNNSETPRTYEPNVRDYVLGNISEDELKLPLSPQERKIFDKELKSLTDLDVKPANYKERHLTAQLLANQNQTR